MILTNFACSRSELSNSLIDDFCSQFRFRLSDVILLFFMKLHLNEIVTLILFHLAAESACELPLFSVLNCVRKRLTSVRRHCLRSQFPYPIP